MGDMATGLSQELWWTPANPFKSSLTGITSAQLAKDYEAATGRQWNGGVGFAHSMFELVADVVKRAKDPTDKASLRDAIVATKLDTTVGHIDWSKGPMKNVCKTPLVAGQWVKGPEAPLRPHRRRQHRGAGDPGRGQADRHPLLSGPRTSAAMTVLLAFDNVSKSFGALKVTD